MPDTAIVAGLGPGFCERFAWQLAEAGYGVGMFARSADYLAEVESDLRDAGHDALAVPLDLTDPGQVAEGVARCREELGRVEVLAHTASAPTGGYGEGLDADRFESAWRLYAHSALLCVDEVLPDMRGGGGTILFFGAAREMGDYAYRSAKDAARGLARSLADEYGPEGVHVAHVVISGPIRNPDVYEGEGEIDEERYMDPDAVAGACMDLIDQDESAWTFELDLRPHVAGL